MTPFYQSEITEESVLQIERDLLDKWKSGHAVVRSCFPEAKTEEEAVAAIREMHREKVQPKAVWMNDTYQVQVRDADTPPGFPKMIWLSIRKLNRSTIRDWREIQQIKNAIVGPENEGCELYPAESRLTDTANQYHVWVIADPTIRFPFGFEDRHVSDEPVGNSFNRKL